MGDFFWQDLSKKGPGLVLAVSVSQADGAVSGDEADWLKQGPWILNSHYSLLLLVFFGGTLV